MEDISTRRRARPAVHVTLTATVLGTLVAGVALTGAPAALAQQKDNPKNVIILIGDGMGRTHVTAARQRYYGAAERLVMETAPVVGQVSTYAVEPLSDLPALVTDSASSATAWSSGVKTYNAGLGVDAFGKKVPTLMEQAKAAGMSTGNVSTAEITDATPAGMFSHALLRGCQGPTYSDRACKPDGITVDDPSLLVPIAEQISRNGTADVILGGGLARFEPDDAAALTAQGYTVLGSFGDANLPAQTADSQRVATREDLRAASASKVVGLFNRGNMTVEKAKLEAPAGAEIKAEPTLPEMTAKAIDLLKGNDKGFLLQVEAALIDKRSHANDAAQTLLEIKDFDDAVKVARDYAADDGNTLVVVTADHECAGFNVIEQGTFTNAEAAAPPGNIDSGNPANNSTPTRQFADNKRDPARSNGLVNGPTTAPEPTGSPEPSPAATGTAGPYGAADPNNFAPATFRTADDPAGVTDGTAEASLWLTYLSGNHTGADVPIYAFGPQASRYGGTMNNTDIYRFTYDSLAALGNKPAPAGGSSSPAPIAFRAIVQGRGNGTVLVAVNDVQTALPGAQVVVYYRDRGGLRFVRNLQLDGRGRTTVRPAVFRLPRGTQQSFLIELRPNDGTNVRSRSQVITTYVS